MSEVNPPSQPPAPPHVPTGGQPRAVVTNPPETFSKQVALGTRFEATILATSQKGHRDIQTPFGRVTLQTTTPLPNDGILQLQLLSKGNQLQFLITTINGLAPLTALRALGLLPVGPNAGKPSASSKDSGLVKRLPLGLVIGAPQGTNNETIVNSAAIGGRQLGIGTLMLGANLSATLLNAKGPFADRKRPTGIPSVTSSQLTSGSVVRTSVLPGQTSTPGKPQSDLTGSLQKPINTKHQLPGGGSFVPLVSNQPAPRNEHPGLSPGTKFTVQITAFHPSPATGIVAPKQDSSYLPAPGSILTGTITGKAMPSGYPVIQTHAGSIAIVTSSILPIGSQVTFVIKNLTQSINSATERLKTNETFPPQSLIRKWPALQDAIRTLGETNPAAAQQLIQAVLPKPGPTLGGNIIFFMMALSGGNLSSWFGDLPMRALQLSKPELLERLKKDFIEIERITHNTNAKEWRSTLIPFYDGVGINPLRLSIKYNSDGNQGKGFGNKDGTNFIIDLDLNIIGRFQLDGLVYRERKRMDLIVRTNNPLSQTIENGIRSIFKESTDTIGLMGGVVFQATPANFVETSDDECGNDQVGLLV